MIVILYNRYNRFAAGVDCICTAVVIGGVVEERKFANRHQMGACTASILNSMKPEPLSTQPILAVRIQERFGLYIFDTNLEEIQDKVNSADSAFILLII